MAPKVGLGGKHQALTCSSAIQHVESPGGASVSLSAKGAEPLPEKKEVVVVLTLGQLGCWLRMEKESSRTRWSPIF